MNNHHSYGWRNFSIGNAITIAIVVLSFILSGVAISNRISAEVADLQLSIQNINQRLLDQNTLLRKQSERISFLEALLQANDAAPDPPPASVTKEKN